MSSLNSQLSNFAQLPSATKALVLVLIVGLLTGAYYSLFYSPLESDLQAAKQQHVKLGQEQIAAKATLVEFVRVSETLLKRKSLDQQNRRVLPERAEIAAFLQDLNRTAELSGLSIDLVEPRAEEMKPLYVKVPVNIAISGSYHQVTKFFYSISQLDRAISLEDAELKVRPSKLGEPATMLDVQVLATTFRKPAAADAAGKAGHS